MAFILSGNQVVSFADALDLRTRDQRVFEANEIDFTNAPDQPDSLDTYVEDLLTRSTARIAEKIRASAQWRKYLGFQNQPVTLNEIPPINLNLILLRQADFTDMCVYYCLKEYLLPKVADFGNPESSEVQKIKYYDQKFYDLFSELMDMLDWYDFDGDGNINQSERFLTQRPRRRSRASGVSWRVR
jgi:hypothetical protein